MEKQGLLFIPDISGFTRFVNGTEIEHSRLIIQELLEQLINSNQLGLEVSEIEGDAILFYKFGMPPELKELYQQVERMFCSFHRTLTAYDNRRYCQCKACTSAVDLTLKIITHYGEFTGYNVKNFNKLIGRDIIIAHQLLKNDIEQHEYWLVTKALSPDLPPAGIAKDLDWNSSSKQTDDGEIKFQYALLSRLRNEISHQPLPKPDLTKKQKMISVSGEYDTDIITMFHATGDFNFRHRWREGVKRVEEVAHYLPRVGMKCRCIMENGETVTYSSSYFYQPEHIEFSEMEENNDILTYYTLEEKDREHTKLTLDVYIDKSLVRKILFTLKEKKKMEKNLQQSLQNLTGLVKEIKFPEQNWQPES